MNIKKLNEEIKKIVEDAQAEYDSGNYLDSFEDAVTSVGLDNGLHFRKISLRSYRVANYYHDTIGNILISIESDEPKFYFLADRSYADVKFTEGLKRLVNFNRYGFTEVDKGAFEKVFNPQNFDQELKDLTSFLKDVLNAINELLSEVLEKAVAQLNNITEYSVGDATLAINGTELCASFTYDGQQLEAFKLARTVGKTLYRLRAVKWGCCPSYQDEVSKLYQIYLPVGRRKLARHVFRTENEAAEALALFYEQNNDLKPNRQEIMPLTVFMGSQWVDKMFEENNGQELFVNTNSIQKRPGFIFSAPGLAAKAIQESDRAFVPIVICNNPEDVLNY